MTAPTWSQEPKLSNDHKTITAKAHSDDASKKLSYLLKQEINGTWTDIGLPQVIAADATATFTVEPGIEELKYRVTVHREDQAGKGNVLEGDPITLPKAAPIGPTEPAQPRYFYKGYAWAVGIFVLVLAAPVLALLLRWGTDLPTDEAADSAGVVAGVIGLGLLAIGVVIAAGGLLSMLIEHRATMIKAPTDITRDAVALDADAQAKLVTAFGNLKAPWAVMIAAIAAFVASAWVGVHIADSAKPTTTTTQPTGPSGQSGPAGVTGETDPTAPPTTEPTIPTGPPATEPTTDASAP